MTDRGTISLMSSLDSIPLIFSQWKFTSNRKSCRWSAFTLFHLHTMYLQNQSILFHVMPVFQWRGLPLTSRRIGQKQELCYVAPFWDETFLDEPGRNPGPLYWANDKQRNKVMWPSNRTQIGKQHQQCTGLMGWKMCLELPPFSDDSLGQMVSQHFWRDSRPRKDDMHTKIHSEGSWMRQLMNLHWQSFLTDRKSPILAQWRKAQTWTTHVHSMFNYRYIIRE